MASALNALLLPVWVIALAELVGVPVAWLKVRRTAAWESRPAGARRIALLRQFISPVAGFAALWSVVVAVAILLGWALSESAIQRQQRVAAP